MTAPNSLEHSLETTRRQAEFLGLTGLSDEELVALILGRGGDGLSALVYSRSLLDQVGGVGGLGRLRTGGLADRPGMGSRSSTRLLAAVELGRRAAHSALEEPLRKRLTAARVADWAIPRLGPLDHEEVWVLCVDGRTSLRSAWQVGRGGIHGCALLPRDLLTPVIRDAASGFVLVHNHPSGDPTPSPEDVLLTKNLESAAITLSTPLLDHIIVSRSGYRSMFEDGLVPFSD